MISRFIYDLQSVLIGSKCSKSSDSAVRTNSSFDKQEKVAGTTGFVPESKSPQLKNQSQI